MPGRTFFSEKQRTTGVMKQKLTIIFGKRSLGGVLSPVILVPVILASLLGSSPALEWRLLEGPPLEAEFQRIQNEAAYLKAQSGDLKVVELAAMDPASRQDAQRLWGEHLSRAVQRIDEAILNKLKEEGIAPNAALTDEQFVRRVYLDLTGTIPTYEQTSSFLTDRDPRKRFNLISKLVDGEGFVSHHYNYFAELLRIQDYVPGTYVRTDVFGDWIKQGIRENRPYNEMVYDMVTADGRIWDNPAVGFYLRDYDTKLDHVQYTAKVFLGTDIACAQCHDDPFQDWTQMDYYRLTAFLSEVESKDNFQRPLAKNAQKEIEQEVIKRHNVDMDAKDAKYELNRAMRRYQQPIRWMQDASKLVVREEKGQKTSLPDLYDYPDGKPGDTIMPIVPFGDDPEYIKGKNSPREQYARWMTSPENPRFALNIANRMWDRFFGRGVGVPLHNVDVESVDNPELLAAIEEEMIGTGFDLKTFALILANTKAYQRLASREKVTEADPYHFQGPLLRRMSAEQVWDSMMTLMVEDPLRFRKGDGGYYNETVNLLNEEGPMTAKEFFARAAGYQRYSSGLTNYVQMKNGVAVPVEPVVAKPGEEMMMNRRNKPTVDGLTYGDLLLTRASEQEQPSGNDHFLRKFGQSERNFVVGASSRGGSVPQIMEMMNGFATEMITKPDSMLFKKMDQAGRDRMKKADIVFLSILNRKQDEFERGMIYDQLKKGSEEDAYGGLIWALLNTPEFFFIK